MRPHRLALASSRRSSPPAAFSTAAFAHVGGHPAGFSNGFAHPFYRPRSCAGDGGGRPLGLAARRPALWLLPLTFPVVMAAGAALGFGGVALPGSRSASPASVLVLGALIAFALRPSLAVSAALIGLFALFHGYAHGTALPAHGTALTFALGLVLATVMLHGVGLASACWRVRSAASRCARRAARSRRLGVVLLVLH